MSGNLQEFIGMVSIVSAATFFVVGLRFAILKFGEEVGEQTSPSKVKV